MLFSAFTSVFVPLPSLAQSQNAPSLDVSTLASAAKDLCGGSGTSVDVKAEGSGEVTLLVGQGPVKGTVQISRSEWTGIEAMRHDAARYGECVQTVTPMLSDRLKAASIAAEQRHQTCLANCDISEQGCAKDLEAQYADCIEERRKTCLHACKVGYDVPYAECISKYCNVEYKSNKLDWPATCRGDVGDATSCTTHKAECRNACK